MAKPPEYRDLQASPERLFEAVVTAAPTVGFKVKQSDPAAGTVVCNTGMSMWSWAGQDLAAHVEPTETPGVSRLTIGGSISRDNPLAQIQVVSWGEKGRVTAKLFAAVERQLQSP